MLYFYIETDDYTLRISTSILKQMIHIAHIYCYLERNNYTIFVVLQELGTDKNLYALVFGESVLNDAGCRNFYLLNILLFKLIN